VEKLAGIGFYNPYAAGPQTSERFRTWQIERARGDGAPAAVTALLREAVFIPLVLAYTLFVAFVPLRFVWPRSWMGGVASMLLLLPGLPVFFPSFLGSEALRNTGSMLAAAASGVLPANPVVLAILFIAVSWAAFRLLALLFDRVDLHPRHPASDAEKSLGLN
jgi:hypothetical protein